MNRKYILSIVTLIFVSAFMFAQDIPTVERTNNKVVIEGKVYFVHVVKKGHTLYAISKAYSITEKELVIENPGVTETLSIGQVLKIPENPTRLSNVNTANDIREDQRVHRVREGETAYAISRIYMCSVAEIQALNPGLNIYDIPIDFELAVPGQKSSRDEDLLFNEEGVISHTVKKGETLSSIARYYRVSPKEIRNLNKEIGWGRIRIGDFIRVPRANTTVAEVFEPLDSHLLLDSMDADIDTVDKFEDYLFADPGGEFCSGKVYNVAYLIPFNYAELEPLDSLLKDVKYETSRQRIREDYKREQHKPKATNFLEFMEGSILAIDSLTDVGARYNVRFYDTKRSMFTCRQILAKPELKEMDLIIGPFHGFNLELANEFSRKHRIPLLTPFHSHDSLLHENPYLFQPTPSYKTEIDYSVKYIAREADKNLIFVHSGDSLQEERIAYYKERLFKELDTYAALESVLFKEVILQKDGNTEGLIHALQTEKANLVIVPETDEALASQVAAALNFKLGEYDIEVFGSSSWLGFDDVEIGYMHALQLVIPQTHWYDYEDPNYLGLLKKFRKGYFKEPAVVSSLGYNYGVLGYDLSLFFLSALHQYGKRFLLRMDEHNVPELQLTYLFEKESRSSGFENKHMNYYLFGDDLKVSIVDLPEKPVMHHYMRPAEDDSYFYWQNRPVEQDTVKQDSLQ